MESMMANENTITEQDMDASAQNFVQGLRGDAVEFKPDLIVDGLSDSILSRLLLLFGKGKS